jgi:hypothetical protein
MWTIKCLIILNNILSILHYEYDIFDVQSRNQNKLDNKENGLYFFKSPTKEPKQPKDIKQLGSRLSLPEQKFKL